MGKSDREVKVHPNAMLGYVEASIVVNNSKLKDHLENITEEEKQTEFKLARRLGTKLVQKNKETLKGIIETRREILKQKEIGRAAKKDKAISEKSKIVTEISHYGGQWTSAPVVDSNLHCFTQKGRREIHQNGRSSIISKSL